MNNKMGIDPIDEVLRLIYLESTGNNQSDANKILSFDYLTEIPESKKKFILENLFQSLSIPTFGELLKSEISINNFTLIDLSTQTNLSEDVLNELILDNKLTNSFPVNYIKKILKTLKISFEKAEKSILKTFQVINKNNSENLISIELLPAFRKDYHSVRKNSTFSNDISSRELFENEEALRKYLNRLKELIID